MIRRCLRHTITIVLFSVICISGWGCDDEKRNFTFPAPPRFAEFTRETGIFKAISSDGVRIKVHRIENKPYGDLVMWNDAIMHHLKGVGYALIASTDLAATNNLIGKYSEYRIHYNGDQYCYALAVFTDTKYIYLLQAGGIEQYFNSKREAIKKSIAGFSIDK